MCSWSLIIILTKGKFVDQSDPWTWSGAISGHSNESIFHMEQTMENNFDSTVLTTRQLTTTLPLIMTDCSLYGMEMSVNNSILVTRVVNTSWWNAPFLHETSARNQSLRISFTFLWGPTVLSLKLQTSTCGGAVAISAHETQMHGVTALSVFLLPEEHGRWSWMQSKDV